MDLGLFFGDCAFDWGDSDILGDFEQEKGEGSASDFANWLEREATFTFKEKDTTLKQSKVIIHWTPIDQINNQ